LYTAAGHGHASVVELLLKADGVDVNKGYEDGATPLFIAAREGHTSVVELLLKAEILCSLARIFIFTLLIYSYT